MVLHPIHRSNPDSLTPVSAWDAIECRQREGAQDWWLISQPDHAELSGTLARSIESPDFPAMDEEIFQAIALHDEGWSPFDQWPQVKEGRPVSFLNVSPPDFLQAWRGSIERAAGVSTVGGIVVSEHFCRIARMRPPSNEGALIEKFLQNEKQRQDRLSADQSRSREEIEILVDVLQFCDLLSLYLCCGSRADIEFPQTFAGRSIGLYREDGLCCLQPPIFGGGVSLGVQARRFSDFESSVSIPALLR